jgi:hypothetical protein
MRVCGFDDELEDLISCMSGQPILYDRCRNVPGLGGGYDGIFVQWDIIIFTEGILLDIWSP